jgi:hypothetical protein
MLTKLNPVTALVGFVVVSAVLYAFCYTFGFAEVMEALGRGLDRAGVE